MPKCPDAPARWTLLVPSSALHKHPWKGRTDAGRRNRPGPERAKPRNFEAKAYAPAEPNLTRADVSNFAHLTPAKRSEKRKGGVESRRLEKNYARIGAC